MRTTYWAVERGWHAMRGFSESASGPTGPTSFYKYVNLDGLGRILTGSVRLTQPTAFNDPFELLPEIVMPTNEPERKISVQFDILGERRNPPVGDVEVIPDGFGSGDPTSRDIVDQLNRLIGIFCLSRKPSRALAHGAAGQFGGFLLQASKQAVCTTATYQRTDFLLLRYDLTNRAVGCNVDRLPASRGLAHRVAEDVRIVARLARHDLDSDHRAAGRRRRI